MYYSLLGFGVDIRDNIINGVMPNAVNHEHATSVACLKISNIFMIYRSRPISITVPIPSVASSN